MQVISSLSHTWGFVSATFYSDQSLTQWKDMQANQVIFPSKQRGSVQKAMQRGTKHRTSSMRDFEYKQPL